MKPFLATSVVLALAAALSACSHTPPVATSGTAAACAQPGDALGTVKQWFATLDKSWLADNVQWRVSGGYPVQRRLYTSRDDVFGSFFPELRGHFGEWRVNVKNYSVAGNNVFVEGSYVGTVKDSGAPIEIEFIHNWTVCNGKITALNAVADSAQFAVHQVPYSMDVKYR